MSQTSSAMHIARNIAVHDRIARQYDKSHGEIFNDFEQSRLADTLRRARDETRTGSDTMHALDFGCGSGNLTRHLLDLGLSVTAADVSSKFLAVVVERFGSDNVQTLQMNGTDLSEIADNSFDFIGVYSVLHHIPDYLLAISELARVCKQGGVILLDHEPNQGFWTPDDIYRQYAREVAPTDWKKFLKPSNYVHKAWRMFDPRHANEGDIHVWPDDHIEWDRVSKQLTETGFAVVLDEDYLLYRANYRRQVYDRYVGRCTDTKAMAFRKR